MAASPTTSITFQNFFSTTLTSDIPASATDIFLNAVPNGSEGFLVIDPDNSTYREVIYYNSKTASKVICPSAADGRGQDDTSASAHTAGTTVIMAPIAAYFETLLALFTTSPQGWTSLSGTFTSPTYSGNRSYTVTTSVDQTSVLSRGMRLRTTRTVTAPVQCTSLNGSSQYFNKTSPNKLTFTDDFVAMAWAKPTAYQNATIVSRYNGTSGWVLLLNASGQVVLVGFNAGAANFSQVVSNQSVPLNRWVHVTAQLDMSSFTATPTTSYVMLDGVDVSCSVSRAGTNPTALVQAGNLEIGSNNGGSQLFAGKLAQVAVFNAKVTQATVRGYISQGLAGNETSIASAYSFNNAITDLNTTTPNDLTAQGAAVATNSDSPFTLPATGVPGGTLDYGVIVDVSASTLTVQVPEGCAIPTSGGISAASYSTYKAPFGFPTDPARWEILVLVLAAISAAGTVATTIYNPGGLNISVPIGVWDLEFSILYGVTPSAAIPNLYVGLQTSNSAFVAGQEQLTSRFITHGAATSNFTAAQMMNKQQVAVSAATPYYALVMDFTALGSNQIRGAISTSVPEVSFLKAAFAYL